MRRFLYQVLALALFSIAFVASASAQSIQRIVFFGDSLSDSGNNFILTGQSTRIPYPIGPASFSYDTGGHQYSNGMVWSQYVANALHLPHSGLPSLQSRNGDFTDYGVGEARSRTNAPAFPDFNLTAQVDIFLSDFDGTVPANTLVVIWIGANDLEDALNALSTDPSGGASENIIGEAVTVIFENMQVLYAHGAREFLIANIPDLSKTPYVRFLGQTDPTIPTLAAQFTNEFNVALAGETEAFSAVPGLQFFHLFDVNALLNEVIAAPGGFHLLDATDRCTVPLVQEHAICNDPDSYLFWDATHPTTAGHRVIAAAVLSLLPPQRARGHR
jgi:phospholipase/lecithinase/hemolysin